MLEGGSREAIETGLEFRPTFDSAGLILCVTADRSGHILMVAYMNEASLRLTLDTGIVHYWSRSRQALWRKGDTSGQVQHLVDMRVDCDQDALLLSVEVAGDGRACHTGRRSCFYRSVIAGESGPTLRFVPDEA